MDVVGGDRLAILRYLPSLRGIIIIAMHGFQITAVPPFPLREHVNVGILLAKLTELHHSIEIV